MMGGSNVTAIPYVIQALQELNPKSIIDIGAGRGKYGMLCREYIKGLEILDGLEPSGLPRGLYDYTWEQDIQKFDFVRDYDVALLIAVMCRFTKEEGRKVLQKINDYCEYTVLTIEKEQHGGMTQWYPSDFPGAKVIELPYEYLIIC